MKNKVKNKKEKGITLVALIITVVLLLILAAVAITAIKDNKIVLNAETTVDKYNDKVRQEENSVREMLDKYNKTEQEDNNDNSNTTGGNTTVSCTHANAIKTGSPTPGANYVFDGVRHHVDSTNCPDCGTFLECYYEDCDGVGCSICGFFEGYTS